MSELDNSKPVVDSSSTVVRVFLGAVVIACIWLILPLYMQNRMNALYEQSNQLNKQVIKLEVNLQSQKFEINKLSSMERLLKISEEWGLGLYDVPTKVRVVGGLK